MNRNRLAIRLVLIIAVVVIFFLRRNRMSPDAMWGFLAALGFAVVFTVVRMIIESKRKKQNETLSQQASQSKDVELFSKPKDF
jgi:ABC-type Mn2+/Zn2+ transport system permease subunit